MLDSSTFEPRSGQTKDYKIGICCFSAKHTVLRRKSKGWLARNQAKVSEWSNMSTLGLLFQWARCIKIQLGVLIYYKANISSFNRGSTWPWSYGSLIYNYLCNQCLSPLMLWVRNNWLPRYSWNIVESGIKHHQANKQTII